jgi:hypothetical protein
MIYAFGDESISRTTVTYAASVEAFFFKGTPMAH